MPVVQPIGPGPESVAIELYAADPLGARWDKSSWDGGVWAGLGWAPVGCEVAEASYRWGATAEAGLLSAAEAGELDLGTIDPQRVLDPMNTAGPHYGYIRPGTPIRLRGRAPGDLPAWQGWIDEASHDLASAKGRIRAIDGLAAIAQAQVPDGSVLPNTLRARVRRVVELVGLGTAGAGGGGYVPVEPELPDADADPPVAPFDGKAAGAWQVISNAAADALVFVWLDPTGMLRFRSWGAFPDAPLSIGCRPPDADPLDIWLVGISTIEAAAQAGAVRNSVRAWSATDVFAPAAIDGPSISRYGARPYDVPRVVPARDVWAARILADRADAGLELALGEIRPYDEAELAALLQLYAAGPAIVRVRDDAHGELVDTDVGMIGATVGVTAAGWRTRLVTMISRVDWESETPEPPEPPEPPTTGDPWHTETRTYVATSDALLALTSGGAKYGAGASTSLPVGGWQGWTYRACVRFPSIPWTKVRAVKSATLIVQTTTQVRVGFGSSPKMEIRRITESWSAGSSSSPSSSNAVVWPGPATTSSGAVSWAMGTAQNASKRIGVTNLVRPWAPASIGGSGASQYGIALRETGTVTATTTEVWPVEQGGSARPTLEIVVEVYD